MVSYLLTAQVLYPLKSLYFFTLRSLLLALWANYQGHLLKCTVTSYSVSTKAATACLSLGKPPHNAPSSRDCCIWWREDLCACSWGLLCFQPMGLVRQLRWLGVGPAVRAWFLWSLGVWFLGLWIRYLFIWPWCWGTEAICSPTASERSH